MRFQQNNPDTLVIRHSLGEVFIAAIAFSVGLLLVFGSLGYVLVSFTKRVKVTATVDQVKIESVSWIGKRTRILAGSDIEEVVVNQPLNKGRERHSQNSFYNGIAIRSNHKTIAFGSHLPMAEQNFLSQFLRSVLEA